MSQPTKTEATKNFLTAMTHPGLAELYNHDMEMQLNVAQDGGTRIDGEFKGRQWQGWSDGTQTWKSFRVPLKANSEPEYTDTQVSFDIAAHAEGIGMTGWDWKARVSRWVAFDFDAISGHSDRHSKKLTEQEMQEVLERMSSIPWTTIRRSTSGKGLHIYVFLEPVPTANHNEHAALARAILGQLSALTRYDFQAKVDTCGGNMWVWHRKMKGTPGLVLLKRGELLKQVPENWRDHMTVVTGTRRKTLPEFIVQSETPDADTLFDELTGQRTKITLDPEHVKLMEWLRANNCYAYWDQDHWMMITHTFHLKEAHKSLQLKGIFETISTGTEAPNDKNCFCFPGRRGSWTIRRFSQQTAESPTWTQDGTGWTRCYYNKPTDLANAARACGGVEHPKGGFVFVSTEQVKKAADMLGAELKIPQWAKHRQALLKETNNGKLVVTMDRFNDDESFIKAATDSVERMTEWITEKGKWTQVVYGRQADSSEVEIMTLDDTLRHVVTPGNEDAGWLLKSEGAWRAEPINHVRSALKALGHNPGDVETIIGSSVVKCWTLVNKPFFPEYPAQREWNRNAVQLRYRPTLNRDNLEFPTWNKLLNHLGRNLDDAISQHPWAKANGIMTGGDYLKCWIASLFQAPEESLPYLFFYGSENCGKSSFHIAISYLVTHGVVRAEDALQSQYNGELATAILCAVEEVDLKSNRLAHNKMKDWVTSPQISIRAMYNQPYLVPNMTHWVQMSNHASYCPIFPGDTRITAIAVPDLEPGQSMPRKDFHAGLQREAPDFLAEILSLELPPPTDRLNVPVIVTNEKLITQRQNSTLLEQFITEMCHHVPGEIIKYSEFCDKFRATLDPTDMNDWGKIKIARSLPPKFPKGRLYSDGSQHYIGNMSWFPKQEGQQDKPLITVRNDALVDLGGPK